MADRQSLCHYLKWRDGDSSRRLIVSKLGEDLANSIEKSAPKLHRGVHLCDARCIAGRGAEAKVFPLEQEHFVNVIICDHHLQVSSIKVGASATGGSLELNLDDLERAEIFPIAAGDLIALKATRWLSLGLRRFPTAYFTIMIDDFAYVTNCSNPHFHDITLHDLTEAEKRSRKVAAASLDRDDTKVDASVRGLSPPSDHTSPLSSVLGRPSVHRGKVAPIDCIRCCSYRVVESDSSAIRLIELIVSLKQQAAFIYLSEEDERWGSLHEMTHDSLVPVPDQQRFHGLLVLWRVHFVHLEEQHRLMDIATQCHAVKLKDWDPLGLSYPQLADFSPYPGIFIPTPATTEVSSCNEEPRSQRSSRLRDEDSQPRMLERKVEEATVEVDSSFPLPTHTLSLPPTPQLTSERA